MPLKAWKIQILKKWNKMLEIPSFYTCAPKTAIISGTVPEIQSERDRIFCHFAIFYPFTPLMTRKLTIWKNEKTLGDIIILHMCNINDNHMTYDSWDIRHNWVFCRFGLFLPFSLPNNLKNQNFEKKWKNILEILSFHICILQMRIISCLVPEIWSATDRTFCHFGSFFAFLPP